MSASDRLKGEMEKPGEVPFSEDDLAAQFSTEQGDDLRYVGEWSCWLQWDGEQWRRDRVGRVFQRVRLPVTLSAQITPQHPHIVNHWGCGSHTDT